MHNETTLYRCVAKPNVTRPFLCCWRHRANTIEWSDNFRSEIWCWHQISWRLNLRHWFTKYDLPTLFMPVFLCYYSTYLHQIYDSQWLMLIFFHLWYSFPLWNNKPLTANLCQKLSFLLHVKIGEAPSPKSRRTLARNTCVTYIPTISSDS